MGNSSSKPEEQVYAAVAKNDVSALNRIIASVEARRTTPVRDILNFTDKEGRTPLLVAAAKNHHQVARKLLEAGADVGYINPTMESRGGTALHEATRHRHEALAELLLQFGASPFQANGAGRTCMDEAVLEGAGNLLRRFEQLALWRGDVAVKVSRMGGIVTPYKTRHVLLIPYISFPTANRPAQVRCQMWLLKTANTMVPKSRLWMDGAVATRTSPSDLVLRLHQTHKVPPGDLHHRYDLGYQIFFRVRDGSAAALQDLDQLNAFVASGAFAEPRPLTGGSAAATGASASNSGGGGGGAVAAAAVAAGAVPWNARAPSYMPPLPSLGGGTSSSFTSSAPSSTPPSVASYQPTPAGSGGGLPLGHAPSFGGYPPVPGAADPWGASAAHLAPHSAAILAQAPPAHHEPLGSSTGREVSAAFVDGMRALPGESDADFASRLASAISAHTGLDQPAAGARSPAAAAAAAAAQQQPLSIGNAHVWGGGGAAVPPASQSAPQLAIGAHGVHVAPSAPPLAAVAAGATGLSGGSAGDGEERQCVVCLSAPREVGFLHGASVHVSVCRSCCAEFPPGASCPLCRAPSERVLNVF